MANVSTCNFHLGTMVLFSNFNLCLQFLDGMLGVPVML